MSQFGSLLAYQSVPGELGGSVKVSWASSAPTQALSKASGLVSGPVPPLPELELLLEDEPLLELEPLLEELELLEEELELLPEEPEPPEPPQAVKVVINSTANR